MAYTPYPLEVGTWYYVRAMGPAKLTELIVPDRCRIHTAHGFDYTIQRTSLEYKATATHLSHSINELKVKISQIEQYIRQLEKIREGVESGDTDNRTSADAGAHTSALPEGVV